MVVHHELTNHFHVSGSVGYQTFFRRMIFLNFFKYFDSFFRWVNDPGGLFKDTLLSFEFPHPNFENLLWGEIEHFTILQKLSIFFRPEEQNSGSPWAALFL